MAGTAIMPGEEGRQTRPGDDRERPARERERLVGAFEHSNWPVGWSVVDSSDGERAEILVVRRESSQCVYDSLVGVRAVPSLTSISSRDRWRP